uniref:DUF726 domain-containing protein n=1 Tax=Spongospora subterranea TaxID=70186 RepID=A0A0H5R4L6_9EUKA|eukprot:CRZ03014.1 hypothetical protein [Spongospora subterranea]
MLGDLEPLPVNADTISIDHLSARQRQCILYIFAGSLCCSSEFGEPVLTDLSDYLKLPQDTTWAMTTVPLLEQPHDVNPFIEDLMITDPNGRARILLILLHFCLLRFKSYDARVRVSLFTVAVALGIPKRWVCIEESIYIGVLFESAKESTIPGSQSKKQIKKWMKVGAAAAVGAGLMVLTGGLAAPALGIGVSALGITSIGTFLGSATGAAIVTGLFGVGGGGLASYKMHRRVGALSNFEFTPISSDGSIHVILCISGIFIPNETSNPVIWEPLNEVFNDISQDIFCLDWETQTLINAGKAVTDFIGAQASSFVLTEGLKQTIFGAVMTAMAVPAAVLSAGYLIDNPWAVLISKSDQAGEELGQVLLQRVHGNRPVSLIGFSAGARIIVRALEFLAINNGFGIVQDVFLLGCPYWSSNWDGVVRVVAGRFVNAYSPSDWVLKYVYRAVTASVSACGLESIDHPKVENIDINGIVGSSHTNYIKKMDEIIALFNL